MSETERIEEIKDSIAFDLFMIREDGQVAWTVTPITIDDLYSDPLSGCARLGEPPPGPFHSIRQEQYQSDGGLELSEELQTQTCPLGFELFNTPKANPQIRTSPETTQKKPDYSTVRIYGRSLHLSAVPTAQRIRPSVITIERAALCSIFLETKYHRTLKEPSERDVRRQILQELLYKGKELTPQQAERFKEILSSVESEWSRMSRVRPSIDAFELQGKLGSGGFGVVNMVKEKASGSIYAMKVQHNMILLLKVVYLER